MDGGELGGRESSREVGRMMERREEWKKGGGRWKKGGRVKSWQRTDKWKVNIVRGRDEGRTRTVD